MICEESDSVITKSYAIDKIEVQIGEVTLPKIDVSDLSYEWQVDVGGKEEHMIKIKEVGNDGLDIVIPSNNIPNVKDLIEIFGDCYEVEKVIRKYKLIGGDGFEESVEVHISSMTNKNQVEENKVKIWCTTCNGEGYISIPDYDWDETPIEDMEIDCSECDGKGYTLI